MIEFIKTRNVKSPERDASENAGIDFYIPEKDSFTPEEIKNFGEHVYVEDNTITIYPHSDIKIPERKKSKFPNNVALVAYNKSGIATKKKLITGAEVIDCAYHGEWHIHLINTSDENQTIEFGQKIVQFIPQIIDVSDVVISDLPENEFFDKQTKRGTGGFGSTGV